MKNLLVKLLVALVMLSAQISVFAQPALESLYRNKQYFDLRDELVKYAKETSPELLFYRGAAANRFNRLAESIGFLQKYLEIEDTKNLVDAYEILADNYAKNYEYGKSADIYKILLERFKDRLDAEKVADYENSLGLWSAIRDIPPQKTTLDGDLQIQGTRDKANLLNLPIQINEQKMDFVFDTGANLSVVTASTAQKAGLKIVESSVLVGSSTDAKVKSKLAVAPLMKIGNSTIHNAVFLVLEDKSLFFPQINYQINGIIGFPVMESFGNVTITQKNEISVKAKPIQQNFEPNLCLDGFDFLAAAFYDNRRMTFAFDTGAVTSTFYPLFFEAEKQKILKFSKLQKMKIGGAGGAKDVNAYSFSNLDLTIAGKKARIAKAKIIAESVNDESRYFYGNLGQDLIKQFARMTLDFKSMRIIFE
jgi:hypothetical protein